MVSQLGFSKVRQHKRPACGFSKCRTTNGKVEKKVTLTFVDLDEWVYYCCAGCAAMLEKIATFTEKAENVPIMYEVENHSGKVE